MKYGNSITPLTLTSLIESNRDRRTTLKRLKSKVKPREGTGSFEKIGGDKPKRYPMGFPYHLKTVDGRTIVHHEDHPAGDSDPAENQRGTQ